MRVDKQPINLADQEQLRSALTASGLNLLTELVAGYRDEILIEVATNALKAEDNERRINVADDRLRKAHRLQIFMDVLDDMVKKGQHYRIRIT